MSKYNPLSLVRDIACTSTGICLHAVAFIISPITPPMMPLPLHALACYIDLKSRFNRSLAYKIQRSKNWGPRMEFMFDKFPKLINSSAKVVLDKNFQKFMVADAKLTFKRATLSYQNKYSEQDWKELENERDVAFQHFWKNTNPFALLFLSANVAVPPMVIMYGIYTAFCLIMGKENALLNTFSL